MANTCLCFLCSLSLFLLGKFTYLDINHNNFKVYTSMVFSTIMLCNHQFYLFQNIFIKNSMPLRCQSPFSPPIDPWQPRLCFWLLFFRWIDQFWKFHINGIIHEVIVSAFSFSLMFSRFIHVLAFTGASCSLWLNNYSFCVFTIICLTVHLLMES